MADLDKQAEFESKASALLAVSNVTPTSDRKHTGNISWTVSGDQRAYLMSEGMSDDHANDQIVNLNMVRIEAASVDEIVADVTAKLGDLKKKFKKGEMALIINTYPQEKNDKRVYWLFDAVFFERS